MQGPPANRPGSKRSRKSEMYDTGVLVENPTMGNAFFRKRMGYSNPDSAATSAAAAVQYGFQANWRGKTHFKTPLIAGMHTGVAPGQELETSLYQARAMNPPWPPRATHRTDMVNPSWQQNVSAYGGHAGTIEMLAGNYNVALPMANDMLEEISANAIDEHKRKAIRDPLSNTYALEHRGLEEVLAADRLATYKKHTDKMKDYPSDTLINLNATDEARARDLTSRTKYENRVANQIIGPPRRGGGGGGSGGSDDGSEDEIELPGSSFVMHTPNMEKSLLLNRSMSTPKFPSKERELPGSSTLKRAKDIPFRNVDDDDSKASRTLFPATSIKKGKRENSGPFTAPKKVRSPYNLRKLQPVNYG